MGRSLQDLHNKSRYLSYSIAIQRFDTYLLNVLDFDLALDLNCSAGITFMKPRESVYFESDCK